MSVVGVLYWAFPDVQLLNVHHQSQNTELELPEFPNLVNLEEEIADTIVTKDTIATEAPKPVIPKVIVDSTTDSRVFLQSFYTSLDDADTRKIRVMHYGDSQIEEDRITMQIREKMQAQYGGRGVGLIPLAQTIPTLTVKQELHMSDHFVSPQNGPRRYMVYAMKRDQRSDGLYGPMGQMAEMNDSLVRGSEQIMAVVHPLQANTLFERWRLQSPCSFPSPRDSSRCH